MGFSIGNLIGSIAPALGGILGGTPGFILGSGISAALAPSPPSPVGRATAPAAAPPPAQFATSTVPSPQSFFPGSFAQGFAAPVLRGVGQAAGGAAAFNFIDEFFSSNGNGGKSQLSQILARARQASPGATKKKIIAAAKACGIDTAAGTFGLDVRQVCLVIVSGGSRRRRGISAADIRRTKRTIRFASNLRKDLKKLGGR